MPYEFLTREECGRKEAHRCNAKKIREVSRYGLQNSQAAARSAISQRPADAAIQIDQQTANGKACAAGARSKFSSKTSDDTRCNANTPSIPLN